MNELPKDVDILFISAHSQAALLAYAISNQFRSRALSCRSWRLCKR
jgi:hypothetical protein